MDENKAQNESAITRSDNVTDAYNATNIPTGMLQQQPWILVIYFTFLAGGCLINVLHFLALLRSRRNGILSLILQISLVDLCLLYVAAVEILTLSHQSWYLPPEFCPFFKGTEVLLNTLTTYLVLCYNCHVISLWNLHQLQVKKNKKNPLTSGSSDDSNECLVTRQENRLVTIDYRKRKEDISIVFPTIFVWIVSVSLSVPNFTLSSTLKLKENFELCAVIDMYYGQVLQHSLLIFKIILPIVLLFLSLVILTIKLYQSSNSDIDNILTKKMNEVRRLVIFGIVLTVIYFLTSFQRHFLHFVHIISYSFNRNSINNFKMPPLYNSFLSAPNMTYLAMLHYSGSAFRGLLCLVILPRFSFLIRTKICPCCKVKK